MARLPAAKGLPFGALLLVLCWGSVASRYTSRREKHFLLPGERVAHTDASAGAVASIEDLQQADLSQLVGSDGRLQGAHLSLGMFLSDTACRPSEVRLSSTVSLSPSARGQGLNISGSALTDCLTTGRWRKGWNQLDCAVAMRMHTGGVIDAAWDNMNSLVVSQGPLGAVASCSYKFRDMQLASSSSDGSASGVVTSVADSVPVKEKTANLAATFSSNNYASVSASHSLPTSRQDGAFTAQAWVRPAENGAGTILSKYDTRLNGGFMLGILQSRFVEFAVQSSKGNMMPLKSIRVVPPSVWTHVAVSYGNGEMTIYVNGTLDASREATNANMAVDTPVLIGAFFGERDGVDIPKSLFSGSLDEIQLWEGVRDRAQVRSDSTRRPQVAEKGLAAYWSCDEKSGLRLMDLTGSHHADLTVDQRRQPGAPVDDRLCECSGRGDCVDFACACADGYFGVHCEKNSCPKNCSGHGKCDDHGVCSCAVGFGGVDCARATCPGACSGHGACHFHWPHHECLCAPGWTGATCDKQHAEVSAEFGWRHDNGIGTCPTTTAEKIPTSSVYTITSKGSSESPTDTAWKVVTFTPPESAKQFSTPGVSSQPQFKWKGEQVSYNGMDAAVKSAMVVCKTTYGVGVNVLYAFPPECDAPPHVCQKVAQTPPLVVKIGSCLTQEISLVSTSVTAPKDATRGPHVCSGHGACKPQPGKVGICTCDKGWMSTGSSNVEPFAADKTGYGPSVSKSWLEISSSAVPHPPIMQGQYQDCGKEACPAACSGHGLCRDNGCQCNDGYAGEKCDMVACPGYGTGKDFKPCNGRGECKFEDNVGSCVCNDGFFGPDCSKQRQCPGEKESERTCSNHGNCIAGKCMCDAFHYGVDCSMEVCPNECHKHGKCTVYGCVCETGWAGYDCGVDMTMGTGASQVICDGPPTECVIYSKPYLRDTKPAKSCNDIKQRAHDSGSGVYFVFPNWPSKTTTPVYCDMSTQGGGWSLVRRIASFSKWPSDTDNLMGLKQWGHADNYLSPTWEEPTPVMKQSFSLKYIDWRWQEMMISFGDMSRYMIFSKKDLMAAVTSEGQSHISSTGRCTNSGEISFYARCSQRSHCISDPEAPCNKPGEHCECEDPSRSGQCKCVRDMSSQSGCHTSFVIEKSDTEQMPYAVEICSSRDGSVGLMIGTNCNMGGRKYGFEKCAGNPDEAAIYAEGHEYSMREALLNHEGTNVWIR